MEENIIQTETTETLEKQVSMEEIISGIISASPKNIFGKPTYKEKELKENFNNNSLRNIAKLYGYFRIGSKNFIISKENFFKFFFENREKDFAKIPEANIWNIESSDDIEKRTNNAKKKLDVLKNKLVIFAYRDVIRECIKYCESRSKDNNDFYKYLAAVFKNKDNKYDVAIANLLALWHTEKIDPIEFVKKRKSILLKNHYFKRRNERIISVSNFYTNECVIMKKVINISNFDLDEFFENKQSKNIDFLKVDFKDLNYGLIAKMRATYLKHAFEMFSRSCNNYVPGDLLDDPKFVFMFYIQSHSEDENKENKDLYWIAKNEIFKKVYLKLYDNPGLAQRPKYFDIKNPDKKLRKAKKDYGETDRLNFISYRYFDKKIFEELDRGEKALVKYLAKVFDDFDKIFDNAPDIVKLVRVLCNPQEAKLINWENLTVAKICEIIYYLNLDENDVFNIVSSVIDANRGNKITGKLMFGVQHIVELMHDKDFVEIFKLSRTNKESFINNSLALVHTIKNFNMVDLIKDCKQSCKDIGRNLTNDMLAMILSYPILKYFQNHPKVIPDVDFKDLSDYAKNLITARFLTKLTNTISKEHFSDITGDVLAYNPNYVFMFYVIGADIGSLVKDELMFKGFKFIYNSLYKNFDFWREQFRYFDTKNPRKKREKENANYGQDEIMDCISYTCSEKLDLMKDKDKKRKILFSLSNIASCMNSILRCLSPNTFKAIQMLQNPEKTDFRGVYNDVLTEFKDLLAKSGVDKETKQKKLNLVFNSVCKFTEMADNTNLVKCFIELFGKEYPDIERSDLYKNCRETQEIRLIVNQVLNNTFSKIRTACLEKFEKQLKVSRKDKNVCIKAYDLALRISIFGDKDDDINVHVETLPSIIEQKKISLNVQYKIYSALIDKFEKGEDLPNNLKDRKEKLDIVQRLREKLTEIEKIKAVKSEQNGMVMSLFSNLSNSSNVKENEDEKIRPLLKI